jgi:hypothetical protein
MRSSDSKKKYWSSKSGFQNLADTQFLWIRSKRSKKMTSGVVEVQKIKQLGCDRKVKSWRNMIKLCAVVNIRTLLSSCQLRPMYIIRRRSENKAVWPQTTCTVKPSAPSGRISTAQIAQMFIALISSAVYADCWHAYCADVYCGDDGYFSLAECADVYCAISLFAQTSNVPIAGGGVSLV